MKMFSIRDIKLSVYGTPFFAIDAITATRMLTVAQRDPQTNIYQFPEDFELTELGSFDNVPATFALHDRPKFIISAVSLRNMDTKLQQAMQQKARIAEDVDSGTPEHLEN